MIPGIAISGRAAAGKSTLARELREALNRRAEIISFAAPIKALVKHHHGLDKSDPGGRDALIGLGDSLRRKDKDIWIRPLLGHAELIRSRGLVPICDDLRFLREYEILRHRGWLLVRVDAFPADRRVRLAQAGLDPEFAYSQEPGEVELERQEGWDRIVLNTSPDTLVHEACRLAEQLWVDGAPARAA